MVDVHVLGAPDAVLPNRLRTVHAAQRGALRHHLLAKELDRAEARHLPALLTDPPHEQVEVVRALRQDDRRGLLRIRPVAAHVGVGDLPEAGGLLMRDRDDVAELARVDERLDVREIRRVAEDMPDDDETPVPDRAVDHLAAFLRRRGNRLLEQKVVPRLKRHDRRIVVQGIRHRDHHDVRLGMRLQALAPVLPVLRRGNHFGLLGIGDADDLQLVGMLLRVFRIGAAAIARAEDDGPELFHSQMRSC